MSEWKKSNELNSFNSLKGLLYNQWYKAVADKKFLPPIEASLDLVQHCNLSCSFCNAGRYLKNDTRNIKYMDDDHIPVLLQFLKEWGVKGVCCFTGDTKVELVGGTPKTFEELAIDWEKNPEPFEVMSINENGLAVIGIATNPHKTQEVSELIELTSNRETFIRCTPDHKFMLQDMTYIEAKDIPLFGREMDLMVFWGGLHIISKKIIKLDVPMPVYCLTVEKYHNFALSSGVFVQNCGGGGESTLHKKLPDTIRLTRQLGMTAALSTNGTIMNTDLLDALSLCRFVGVSIDAGNRETYAKEKGADLFDKVITNLYTLAKGISDRKSKCDISYKFLITDMNQYEIYEACKLAKSIGVRDFYARPANYGHQGIKDTNKRVYKFDFKAIQDQFDKCREIETDKFRVFTVVHKFDSDFVPDKNFSQCYAAPICIQICPDNNIYFCPDVRDLEYYKLGSHYPDPKEILKFWGGEKHMKLVFESGKENCSSRCTFGPYNFQCEKLFLNNDDLMCIDFV